MKKGLLYFVLCSVLFSSCCNKRECVTDDVVNAEWLSRSVVYEMNVRQFTAQGTLKAASDHLDRLKELGVDIVWLMPIHPIGELERKGSLGSYYAISDYYAVNPEFGTMDDFDVFLTKAHDLGLRVILDLVANHTSPDAVWAQTHKEWYVLDEAGDFVTEYDWTDIAKLDYSHEELQSAMQDVMVYWVNKGVDGYRCDMAGLVPGEFWTKAIDSIRSINPNIYMLAEGEDYRLHEYGFNATYDWELHHIMNAIARGEKSAKAIKEHIMKCDSVFPKDCYRLLFTSNHDENSWAGTEFERMGESATTFAALCYVLPNAQPLIYTGQEVGFKRRFAFFDKDSVDGWEKNKYSEFYSGMNELKRNSKALSAGGMGGATEFIDVQNESVLAMKRGEELLMLFNLSSDSIVLEGYPSILVVEGDQLVMSPWEYKIITL